jgi:hypothetical protein
MLFQIRSLNDSGAKGDDMANLAGGAEVKGKPSTQVRAYTFFMTAFSAALLVRLMAHPALAFEDPKEVARFGGPAQVAVLALALMSLGGALGGCLYSLRRLSLHSAAGDYSAGHDFSYYARPLSSGISGLMVCLLLLGGALTLTTGSANTAGWLTFSGRMPYLACSLLAGYSGHKFMLKLGGLADYIFAVNKQERSSVRKAARPASVRRATSAEEVLSTQRLPGRAA